MHPRLQELSDHLDRERAGLRAAVDSIPAEQRGAVPAEGAWSALAVLEHLALVEARVNAALQKQINDARANEIGPETDTSPILPTLPMASFVDRTKKLKAPEAAQPKNDRTPDEIWHSLDDARESMGALMAAADGMKLTEITMPHPIFGPLDLYRWFAWVGAHEARHAAQIREIAASLAASS